MSHAVTCAQRSIERHAADSPRPAAAQADKGKAEEPDLAVEQFEGLHDVLGYIQPILFGGLPESVG